MKLCMIQPFTDGIEFSDGRESAEIEHVGRKLRTGEVYATVFTKTALTRDLFDIQTSMGACWKSNALQNTCVLFEF